ncbi:MAG: DUF2192 domain-containing protein [Desulfurococcaceae archaeon]
MVGITGKSPHKKRIQVAIGLLSEFTKILDELDRASATEMLQKAYFKAKLQPIRGKAMPPDIYDKEMATLYVIGKYGLKLHEEYPQLFNKIFYIEETLNKAIEDILNGSYESARDKLKSISPSGVIDSNMVARMLRIPLTMFILGFLSEEDFRKILQETVKAIPEEERTVRNYVRFFIGYKICEAIYKGEVRSKEYKEAYKRALAIRAGFPTSTPSDEYIRSIAESVFGLDKKILDKVLSTKKTEAESHGQT